MKTPKHIIGKRITQGKRKPYWSEIYENLNMPPGMMAILPKRRRHESEEDYLKRCVVMKNIKTV